MLPKRSEFTQVVLSLQDEIKRLADRSKENPALPFMTEQVSRRQALARLATAGPDERRRIIDQVGVNNVLEWARQRRNNAGR